VATQQLGARRAGPGKAPGPAEAATRPRARLIWWRWVLANVVGEVVGFGLATVVGLAAAQAVERLAGLGQAAAMAAGVVLVGAVEGTAVGLAQWLVLRAALPAITRRAWVRATVAGAVVAWGAGMAIGARAGDRLEALAGGSPVVPALGIGLVAGTLLSLFQWPVLRRAVRGAGWWVPAHAVAWAAGMVVAFAGVGAIDPERPLLAAGIGAATGLAMGAVVAALTGLALVWLIRGPHREPQSQALPHPGDA
jgi:hypothetical protein